MWRGPTPPTSIPSACSVCRNFRRIFLSYSLSMIDERRVVIESALSRLAPGGELHIIDFGGQEGLPRWFRPGFRRWLARFHVTPCDELEQDLHHIAARAGVRATVERPYRGYAQYAVCRLNPPAPPGPTSSVRRR